jgi:hypothetical protein
MEYPKTPEYHPDSVEGKMQLQMQMQAQILAQKQRQYNCNLVYEQGKVIQQFLYLLFQNSFSLD